MKYNDSYLRNHDIDWFCNVNGVYIHVASAGGSIPEKINDKEHLRQQQHQVSLLPDIYNDDEIEYNENAISKAIDIGDNITKREHYIESFTAMARKGFVSFDKTNISVFEDNHYHLVCKPRNLDKTPQGLELPSFKTTQGIDVSKETVLNDLSDILG